MSEVRKTLEDARHELTTLHGLHASDEPGVVDGAWQIDTKRVIDRIDHVLAAGQTLAERIEKAFDEAIDARSVMLYAGRNLEEMRASAKLEHAEEWAGAKNNDVRAVMLAGWLEDDAAYGKATTEYQEGRIGLRLALLEIERLKLLVALEGRS